MAERHERDERDERNGRHDDRDVHHELVRLLIEKVRRDPYPSTTMMDLIEEILPPEDVPRYARILMEKIRNDQFPSIDMMARLRDLT